MTIKSSENPFTKYTQQEVQILAISKKLKSVNRSAFKHTFFHAFFTLKFTIVSFYLVSRLFYVMYIINIYFTLKKLLPLPLKYP